MAYALILLRQDGYPCIFMMITMVKNSNIAPIKEVLLPLMKARIQCAYGKQNDYFDHPNTIGWTREGDLQRENSGLAVLFTNGSDGEKEMFVGKNFAGSNFYDITGNIDSQVVIKEDGNALYKVKGGSVSVWVKED